MKNNANFTEMIEVLDHHLKSEPCTTRPAYREGKTPKSVKVASLIRLFVKTNSSLNKYLFAGIHMCPGVQVLVNNRHSLGEP